MGTVQSKAPNPRITDKNDPRYTPLNGFNKNAIKTIVGGQDVMLGGILVIGRQELQVQSYLEEGIKAAVGDTVLIGNRVGTVKAVEYADDNPDVILTLTVIEDGSQRNAASAQDLLDDGFIADSKREVDYVLAIKAGGSGTKTSGGNGAYLSLGLAPTIIKRKTINPETWNPIALAMRNYQGIVPVTISLDVYTDAGVTKNGAGDVPFTIFGEAGVKAVATIVAGVGTVKLEPGVLYHVKNGDGTDAEVQETSTTYFTPTEVASQTITLHNYLN